MHINVIIFFFYRYLQEVVSRHTYMFCQWYKNAHLYLLVLNENSLKTNFKVYFPFIQFIKNNILKTILLVAYEKSYGD